MKWQKFALFFVVLLSFMITLQTPQQNDEYIFVESKTISRPIPSQTSDWGVVVNEEFIMNFKNAILLSLLNKKQITQWQYEKCTDIFKKNIQK